MEEGDILLSKPRNLLKIRDIKWSCCSDARTMLPDEVIEPVFPTAYGCDFHAGGGELVGHAFAYAGGGTDHEDVFVWEGHFCFCFCFCICLLILREQRENSIVDGAGCELEENCDKLIILGDFGSNSHFPLLTPLLSNALSTRNSLGSKSNPETATNPVIQPRKI